MTKWSAQLKMCLKKAAANLLQAPLKCFAVQNYLTKDSFAALLFT
jgi:hypothetical protein